MSRRLPAGPDRNLCLALASGVVVAAVLATTFDAFSFPMCAGLLFLILGTIGATANSLGPAEGGPGRAPVTLLSRPRRALVALMVATIALVGVVQASGAGPGYTAGGTVALAVPPQDGQNIYYGKLEIAGVSDLVLRVVTDEETRARLAAAGVDEYQVAAANGSLAPFTEVRGSGDVLQVAATAGDPGAAAAAARAVLAEIEAVLADLQDGHGIPAAIEVAVVDSYGAAPDVRRVDAHPLLGIVGAVTLALVVGILVASGLRRLGVAARRP
jgi:hypothetical protein